MSNELTKDNMELVKSCLERLRTLHDYNTNFKDCNIITIPEDVKQEVLTTIMQRITFSEG